MSRVSIQLPNQLPFVCEIPIRISDINYGGHVGNDSFLSLVHEARLQFLQRHQFTELNLAGVGLIMGDVAIEFKGELFYGDVVQVAVGAVPTGKLSFDIFYKLSTIRNEKTITAGIAKTGMVCFSYESKRPKPIPEAAFVLFAE